MAITPVTAPPLLVAGTREQLMRAAAGVGSGKGGKKKGGSRTALRRFRPIRFGEGQRLEHC